uniref:Uncharacterized protein n=1 Tax=Oryza brachyantha TaxID=4533 RepID=J3LVU3_ORYBR
MSAGKANLVVLTSMALLFIGIGIGDAALLGNPAAELSLGRKDIGHNPTVYGANTSSNSGDMDRDQEHSAVSHSSERKLVGTDGQTDITDTARHYNPQWYCHYKGMC